MSRTTLKDVAVQAGVSYQTVSKVLNNQASVTPETEARIRQAIEALNYTPNVSARNLRTQSSNLIGYAWRQTSDGTPHPVLDRFLYSAAQVVEAHGYHLLTFLIGEESSALDVTPYQELYARRQVEGFILADTNHNDARIAYLMAQGIPFACFGQANPEWDYCWVDVDGRSGMTTVVNHLVARGHRRIALITWPEGSRAGNDREQGYLRGLQTAGIPFDSAWLVRGENAVQTGVNAISRLMALPDGQRPTAVACVSDQIAIGVLYGAGAAGGLQVGSDIAITGYDDAPMAEFLHPPLTSVRQPIAAVGQQVIELLLKQINGDEIEEKGILLAPELIVRESS
ncbi:MAG: LacI family DNA-binding transcriptional regulator [Chloroflexota bacterium]|jgi:DNA-binding LacI/PurR family transcriptional regulator